ncbi:MAG TPA: hypothetical protein VNW97_13315 [Candidatus Saccharimonadales bacterium]|jgi:hypothetical protein|nr:hypothetical protein [Candidatus Saccharimonadales bacterium]
MTDLKALAYELLHEAQQAMQEEGSLAPTAIVITPAENLIFDIEYADEDEREEIYAQLVDTALDKDAVAVVTVNDVYLDGEGNLVKLQLADGPAERPAEAIHIVISGSGFESWSLTCPYFRQGDHLVFQPAAEKRDPTAELELLGDWTGRTGNA